MLKGFILATFGLSLMVTLVAFPMWMTRGFHEAVVAVLAPAGQ